MGAEPRIPKCPFCRREVHGPEDGVAFGFRGRFLFATCHDHAPYVHEGVRIASRAAVVGVASFVEDRMPRLYDLIQDVRARRRELGA